MRVINRASDTAPDDRGSALAGVLAVFAVTIILVAVALSATSFALGFTSATKAGVQSRAGADAGISFAQAQLTNGNCQATYSEADAARTLGVAALDMRFSVTISSWSSTSGSWKDGCPLSESTQVRIVSTGTATAPGTLGQSRGNLRMVEAIYAVSTTPTSWSIQPSGPATYSYASSGFYGSSQLKTAPGVRSLIQVKEGDATCLPSDIAATSIFTSDIVVANGALLMAGSCQFSGNAWSLKETMISGSAQVHGSVTADSIGLSGSAIVHGDAWATKGVLMSGSSQVKGNLTAASIGLSATAIVGRDAWTNGNASLGPGTWIRGHLTAGSVEGAGSTGDTPTIAPGDPRPAPRPDAGYSVPDWVDFAYRPSDWQGFVTRTITGACDFASIQATIDSLAADKGVIDARACAAGVQISGSLRLLLHNDLAIIANKFELGESAQIASSAGPVQLWLVTPDLVADKMPTCPPSGGFTVLQSFIVDPSVTGMIYTPCEVKIGFSAQWHGQIYGGKVGIGGSAILHYAPLGLPGVNLTSGTSFGGSSGGSSGSPGSFLLGARTSIRDLSNGS